MPLKSTILALNPTSYWPLDDARGSASCLDAMGLTNAELPAAGVTLAAIPLAASSWRSFSATRGRRSSLWDCAPLELAPAIFEAVVGAASI
jgi:hypothetical protein